MIAIYARQSVFKEDSISIESQIEQCKYEVKNESYTVYKDKGYSGKNIERPEFQKLLGDIKAGKITKVVCYKLDRISRSLLDFAEITALFEEYGVEFVSINEKFDTSTAMGRAMLSICMVFAQLERETIQLRVIDAYSARSRAGFYMGGGIPYGFRKVPYILNGKRTSRYKPVPEEAEQIKILFEMYSQPNVSLADIVRYFKSRGIQKTRGVEWSTSRLTEILRNPIYVKADADIYSFYNSRGTEIVNGAESFIGVNGAYLYTKNDVLKKDRKNMSHYEDMILVLAPHEGFIDSDSFIRCRLKAEQNVQIPNGKHSHSSWISGKLKCLKCGYALRYNKWTGKSSINEYYLCSSKGDKRCEGIGAIHKNKIENAVLSAMKEKVQSLKIEQTNPSKNEAEINSVKLRIAAKESEIDKILENFLLASPAVIERMNKVVDKLTDEIEELNKQIISLESSSVSRTQLDTKAIEMIFDRWDEVEKEDKQKIVDILITKVLVSKEKIEIVWKI